MEMAALWKLSYGMYAIGTLDGERPTGCIVNTVVQITSKDPVIAVSMNKNNYTYDCIKKTGRFSVSVISEQTTQNVIAKLGFSSGRDTDKFAGDMFSWEYAEGLPVIGENCSAQLIADVIAMHEVETHFVILARVKEARVTSDYDPMTYKYYHDVIKGKAPKNAPTYQEPKAAAGKETWVCSVCGFIYEGDLTKEPDTFRCPVCKQPKSAFRKQSANL